jgi:hypothetical protein
MAIDYTLNGECQSPIFNLAESRNRVYVCSVKERVNITINPAIHLLAKRQMAVRLQTSFSSYLEQLIREQWARDQAAGIAGTYPADPPSAMTSRPPAPNPDKPT